MRKTAVLLIFVAIFAKIFGFLRDIILSYYYGASTISDAFLISITIPGTIFAFIGTGIATNLIPIYGEINKKESEEQVRIFTNNILCILLILCSIIIFLVLLFTVPIVKAFAIGFDSDTLNLAVGFTKVNIFGIYFSCLVFVYTAYLQYKGEFVGPSLVGIPLSFVGIVTTILSYKYNLYFLSVGNVIAMASQLIFIIPYLYKKKFRFSFVFNIKDQHLKKMFLISVPVILGVSVNQINVLVDRSIASTIEQGGISALTYANRLNLFIQGVFVVPIISVMYPLISKMAIEKNIKIFKKHIHESIGLLNLILIPITVGFVIFSEPIIRILFDRGAFNENAVGMTSEALLFYSIGFIGFGIREVITRSFYSMGDTKTPMINAIICMLLNILFNIILSKYIGVGGLALGTSISAIISSFLLFFSLRKKVGYIGLEKMVPSFIKILISSLIMGLLAIQIYSVLIRYTDLLVSFSLTILFALLTYITGVYILRVNEIQDALIMIRRKLRGKKN